jgi:hypothetical protein
MNAAIEQHELMKVNHLRSQQDLAAAIAMKAQAQEVGLPLLYSAPLIHMIVFPANLICYSIFINLWNVVVISKNELKRFLLFQISGRRRSEASDSERGSACHNFAIGHIPL